MENQNIKVISDPLNNEYTFNSFIEGECNREAFKVCISVASNPCKQPYNPLIIYGGHGLGKSHLLHAMFHEIKNLHPHTNPLYLKCETLVSLFVEAIKRNTLEDFLNELYSHDSILLDDIHYVSGKPKTQQLLIGLFDRFLNLHRQLVFSSTIHINKMKKVDKTLISRFGRGLSMELKLPDIQTQVDIITMKANTWGYTLSEDTIYKIGGVKFRDIRELEGELAKWCVSSGKGVHVIN